MTTDTSLIVTSDNTELEPVQEMTKSPILDELLQPIRTTALPIHQERLMLIADTGEREALADVFSMDARPLKDFANMTLQVFGMSLYEVPGGWKGKDGLYHDETYYQARLVVSDPNNPGQFLLLKSSGLGLLQHVYHILNNRGWFRFPDGPIAYRVTIGSNNGHFIHNVSRNPFETPKKGGKEK